MDSSLFLLLLVFFCFIEAKLDIFDSRSYVCKKGVSGLVDCKLSFDGNEEWDAINDNGCYQEAEPQSQSVIMWCPLQCQDSPKAYITENIGSEPSGCDSEAFGVFRRKNDWFLWRAEPCDQQDAVFRIACTRAGPSKNLAKLSMEKVNKPEEMAVPAPVVFAAVDAPTQENNVDEHLPEAVDTILKAMFPSYRKERL